MTHKVISRQRPSGLNTSSTAEEIFAAYSKAAPRQELYERNLKEIKALLRARHGLQLSPEDARGLPQRGDSEFVMTFAPIQSQLAQCAGK